MMGSAVKKSIISLFLSVSISIAGWSQILSLDGDTFFSIPDPQYTGPNTEATSSFGFGGGLGFGIELFDFLIPGVELGYLNIPVINSINGFSSHVLRAGGELATHFRLGSRLDLTLKGGGGYYRFIIPNPDYSSDNQLSGAPYFFNEGGYWTAGFELGLKLSPELVVSLKGGWLDCLYGTGSIVRGIQAGIFLGLDIPSMDMSRSELKILNQAQDNVFPVLNAKYANEAFAQIDLYNGERTDITDVEVRFSAGTYSSGETIVYSSPMLLRDQKVRIPLTANFNETLLDLTETSKLQGVLVVKYKLLDSPRVFSKSIPVAVLNRNSISWDDDKILACFISPNDSAVLEFSKYVAGLVRDRIRQDLDKNLQYAMGLLEAFRLAGMAYSPDPTTPFLSYRKNDLGPDYIQFPQQTLSYRSGDLDDLAVLMASGLEGIGLEAALIPLVDDVLVAFSLKSSGSAVKSEYSEPESFIYSEGKAWVPLRMSSLKEGFLRSWQEGAARWKQVPQADREKVFVTLDKAWEKFPPIAIPASDTAVLKPSEVSINKAFENAMNRFVLMEIEPKLKVYESMLASNPGPRIYNSVGLLYAKFGLVEDAKKYFGLAADTKYIPALVNLGNLAFMEKNYDEAVRLFSEVLKIQPDNKAATLGLAKAKYELDAFSESDKLYGQLQSIDPVVASKYAYLSANLSGEKNDGARASAASDRGSVLWDEE